MMSACERLAAVFESALPVSDQLADSLGVDVLLVVLAGKAERCIAGFFLQMFELNNGKR
ncbi:hypothetical protein D3C73_1623520 [compost metagenome]